MAKFKLKKWHKVVLISSPIVVGLFPAFANFAILKMAEGRVFDSLEAAPTNRVALVLGTAPTIEGRKNLFFERRMRAAAELYRAGKVDRLLVSGDNGRKTYDEPTAMKTRLVELGVPPSAVVCDYAGFRTLDSMVRAKRVFGLNQLTVVTDRFHLPRALFLAGANGIDAVGFASEPVPSSYSPATEVRELGARTLVFLDVISGRQPRYLGKREII